VFGPALHHPDGKDPLQALRVHEGLSQERLEVMRIPMVTDDMLRKVIDTAAAPVAVLFLAGDPDRMWFVSQLYERIAVEFDTRMIFVRIYAQENPTLSDYWMNVHESSELVVFRRSQPMGRLNGEFTTENIRKVVEAVLLFGREA
jgi:hypothetical protein